MGVLEQAVIGNGGLDQDKMAKSMHATRFRTITGDIKLGAEGEWVKPRMPTIRFRGLRPRGMEQFTDPAAEVILHPAAYKTGKLR